MKFSIAARILVLWAAIMVSHYAAGYASEEKMEYPVSPVPFTAVRIEDGFWSPRMETNRKVTLPFDFRKCEETGRIDNFAKAGGLMEGAFEGIYFNDSDVFKVVEGAAYALHLYPDPELDRYLDDLIAKFAAAQEDDGYLYTARTVDPENTPKGVGKARWSNIMHGHELYNVGHMYEAAVAHFLATGKRTFLDGAGKTADLVDRVFGPGKTCDVPGHEEIEIGLCKLYRATGDARYLKLAKFFLDERGQAEHRKLFGAYCQDHMPVVDQEGAVGHAVRAAYLYCGMADVAALTGDKHYVRAIKRIWDDVVETKLYLTGGIGARHGGEAFGDAYELPNESAYNETCAAIANALWNHRLFLLEGDGKYIDVVERVLYNGFLSGISLQGDTFFYVNPMATDGHERSPWFGCSCCPTNVVRFMPSIAGYIYAQRGDALYVNLFIGGTGQMEVKGTAVTLKQEGRYPWDGRVKITVEPEEPAEFTINLRIPGWAMGRPVPGDLYRYMDGRGGNVAIAVNGEAFPFDLEKGFAPIRRTWKAGDAIELVLPMPVRRVLCHDYVKGNRGRVALERGPVVYCAEWPDNGGRVKDLFLPDDAALEPEYCADLLGGVIVLRGRAVALEYGADKKSIVEAPRDFTAIPYYAWSHRGKGGMAVWLPRDPSLAKPVPPPTFASMSRVSASHTWTSDTARAVNDRNEPESSIDSEVPRHTFWDHKGTEEWIQYDFKEKAQVRAVDVYWFDDSGQGGCRVPESWRLLYHRDGKWVEVSGPSEYGVHKDRYNRLTFDPVETDGLRIAIKLREGYSGGILEWRVE